jgi:hypothetical protein
MSGSCRTKREILFSVMASLIFIIGCQDDRTLRPGRTPTSNFPLTAGSVWTYAEEQVMTPFQDPSFTDTVNVEVERFIVGPDTVIGIDSSVMMRQTRIEPTEDGADTTSRIYWLVMEENRLKWIALMDEETGGIFQIDPPQIWLDLPLTRGKTWETNSWGRWTYRVVDTETIYAANRYITCDLLRLSSSPAESDTTIRGDSWYSDYGLMKQVSDLGISYIRGDDWVIIDSVRTIATWNLVRMGIQPD